MKRILGLSTCAAIGLSVACGSSDDPGSGSAALVPIEELPTRYAAAACDAARTCWGDLLEVFTGGENCRDNTEAAISEALARLPQAIADGKVKYDGTRAEACFQAVVARGCSDAGEPAACTEALDGTVATGGECASSFECKGSDTYCKSEGTCPGRCAPRESADGPCAVKDDCQPGLLCDRAVARCFRPASAGDRCGGGTAPECGAGFFCLGEDKDKGQPGNCRTIGEAFSGGAGDPCLVDAPLCRADLRCVVQSVEVATFTIIARCASPVTSGAACKIAIPDACPAGEYCAVPPQALDGTCTRKPGAGAPCAASGDNPPEICAAGMRCDGGQCRPRQKLGGSCQADAVCYSEHCSNGGCASASACE